MSNISKQAYTREANDLAATWAWKGAFWNTQKVTRYLAALRAAAKKPRGAPKYIQAYVLGKQRARRKKDTP